MSTGMIRHAVLAISDELHVGDEMTSIRSRHAPMTAT